MKPIQVYLETNTIKRLKQEALDQDVSLSDIVRKYVGDAIEQQPAAGPQIIKTKTQAAKIAAERTTISDARKVCPIHAVPLDDRGKCLQKKCKYS